MNRNTPLSDAPEFAQLRLSVVSYRGDSPAEALGAVFDEGGGTIGRTLGNQWVLPDPEHFISGKHATVKYRDGGYYITDTSSNGVFMNEGEQPLGRGNTVRLSDGDRFTLGDYEIQVIILPGVTSVRPLDDVPTEVAVAEQADGDKDTEGLTGASPNDQPPLEIPVPLSGTQFDPPKDPAPAPVLGGLGLRSESPHRFIPRPPLQSRDEVEPDALSLPDASRPDEAIAPPAPSHGPSLESPSDQHGPEKPAAIASQVAPQVANSASPARPSTSTLDSSPAADVHRSAPAAELPQHQDDLSPGARVAPYSQDALEAFLEGAGIPELRISLEDRGNFFRLLGATWREAVRGTTATLMARASAKNQFRMSVTMIKPAENNPLKFAMSLENAMKALLDTKSKGRLAPDAAVREAFEDIQAHQAALLAGMQRAIRHLLSQLDPVVVEERLHKRGMLGAMRSTSRKAKNWDEFAKLHEQIARTAESDFESLFCEEFVRAYEDEVDKLRKQD